MLIFPLNVFPWVINGLIEAWVSLKRVNRFLELDELDCQDYYISNVIEGDSDDDITVMVKDGSFGWNVDMLECTQETDNVRISKGFLNEDKRFETKQAENEKLTSSLILRNIDLTVRKVGNTAVERKLSLEARRQHIEFFLKKLFFYLICVGSSCWCYWSRGLGKKLFTFGDYC